MCDSRYFNMFAHSGIQHIGLWFCFLFVFVLCLVRPVLLVSLDCPFLVARCYRFLWIVRSWLPLRFSLSLVCLNSLLRKHSDSYKRVT
jgi:hypothetical protein